ncbi:hypothetical protein CANINC_003541 [Pichia inconspicua]|uniref:Probable cytosolic iron-sulfur protein assembly protein 1 n=1 Tax=Pichia inconspicua TaxID=52247 RepID=A0A4T0WYF6_9ASCO|nr:hypothetical protein CANINC_003541 [[Candida] inconspicua]
MTVSELNLIGSIEAHEEPTWCISLHATLPLVATCSSDKTSKIYDISEITNIKEVKVLDEQTHNKTIRSVSFKPSMSEEYPTLALGSFDATCSIWGADNYRSDWELLAVIEGHENEVKCIDWSMDGKYLASCARDKTIWVWETDEMNEEFECIAVLSEHEGDVKFVKWNDKGGDAHMFISCSYDDTLRVWRQDSYDEDEWQCVAMMRFEGTVWGATWVNDRSIACCTDEGEVFVYERIDVEREEDENVPSTIKKVEEWVVDNNFKSVGKIHEGSVYSVDSNGKKIVSGGRDGVICVYERVGDKWIISNMKRLSHGMKEVNCVRLREDGVVVSCGDDGFVKIWE